MGLQDASVLADHVGDPPRILVLFRVGGAVRDADLPLRIPDQGEGEVELLREPLVLFPGVEADAEDLGVLRLVLLDEVPEPGTLNRSARGVGLRIEPEDDLFSAQVAQADRRPAMVDRLEIRGLFSDIQHACSSKQVLDREPQRPTDRHARYCTRVNELEQWNARYLAGERGESKPSPLVIQAAADLPPGRAIDLACGAGRHALFLAKNGWEVVAVDGSPEAIRITKQRAKRIGVKLETLVADLEAALPLPFEDASFDLVTIVLYLQPALVGEARRLLRAGGTCAIAVKTSGSFAMPLDALRELFAGWEISVARENAGFAEVIAVSQS
jgi:hypothetical protein